MSRTANSNNIDLFSQCPSIINILPETCVVYGHAAQNLSMFLHLNQIGNCLER